VCGIENEDKIQTQVHKNPASITNVTGAVACMLETCDMCEELDL